MWQKLQRSSGLSPELAHERWEKLPEYENEVYIGTIVESLRENMELAKDIMEDLPSQWTLRVNPRWPCNHLAHVLQDFLHAWEALSQSSSQSSLTDRALQARKLQEKVLEIEHLLSLALSDRDIPTQRRLLTRVSLLIIDLVERSYQAALGCREE